MREILAAHPAARAIVVTEDEAFIRPPRQLRRRIALSLVEPSQTYADRIADAVRRRPDLLVIDRLCAETTPAALEAAQGGLQVLSQLDTVFRGAGVARQLLDLGVGQERLGGLTWVLAVQRLPTLCPRCKRPAPPAPGQVAGLRRRYPHLKDLDIWASLSHLEPVEEAVEGEVGTFFRADGCPDCRYTGRHGDIAVFDVFRVDADGPSPSEQPSLLPLEEYMLRLAALGQMPLDDLLRLEVDQLHRTYNLLFASERPGRIQRRAGAQAG